MESHLTVFPELLDNQEEGIDSRSVGKIKSFYFSSHLVGISFFPKFISSQSKRLTCDWHQRRSINVVDWVNCKTSGKRKKGGNECVRESISEFPNHLEQKLIYRKTRNGKRTPSLRMTKNISYFVSMF